MLICALIFNKLLNCMLKQGSVMLTIRMPGYIGPSIESEYVSCEKKADMIPKFQKFRVTNKNLWISSEIA